MPGAPFNPVTGQRAQMGLPVTPGTILATFQVIGDDPDDETTQDTHENYVVCRGYDAASDPYFRYLHDPSTAEGTTPINVAKPYALRGLFPYKRGQVIVAAKIRTKLGDNQGVAADSTGHPETLSEVIELLLDDEDVGISWLDISTPPAANAILYYYLDALGGTGWAGTGSANYRLDATHLSGWVRANYVLGDQGDVGIAFDQDESDPATNGNWDITKAGLYEITLTGTIQINYSGVSDPTAEISLWRKPAAGANAAYTDNAGGSPWFWSRTFSFDSAYAGGITYPAVPVSVTAPVFLEAGDRISLKATLTDPTNVDLRRFDGLRMIVKRIGDQELESTTLI